MRTQKRVLTVLLALVGCSSAQRVEGDAGADGDATQDGDAEIASDGGGDADADADASADSDVEVDPCPGARHGRTITITNSSSVTQYFAFDRPIAMERQSSGAWTEFLPWAWCRTVCDECETRFCEPCDPTLRALDVGESETYEWEGLMYMLEEDHECDWEGSSVPCIERREAPAGRYRVEHCHSPRYVDEEEQFGSCYGVDGYISPASLDAPECMTLELDYDPCEADSWNIVIVDP
jgi:hypothetical protein